MQKVLVTGGCGFIGSHIVDELVKKEYEILVIDNLSTGHYENINHNKNKVFFEQVDILSDEFTQLVKEFQPEYIIHQAAQVSVAKSLTNMTEDAKINIEGSVKVIEEAIKNNVKKIVFASSAAVYGDLQYTPVDVKHPTSPLSPYGLSKLTVENYLQLSYRQFGINFSILRYSNVYGPRQDSAGEGGVVSIFVDKLINNKIPIIHGDGTQTRDFIYVKDVAKANVKALETQGNGLYNISRMESISINKLFLLLCSILGLSISPEYVNLRVGDIKDSLLCNTNTIHGLGWKPDTSIDQGLKMTILSEKQGRNSLISI